MQRIITGLTLFAVMATCLGCAEEFRGRTPIHDGIHYPVGLAVDEASGTLLVANSNFDLTYDSASIVAIDLATNTFLDTYITVGSFPGDLVLSRPDGAASGFGYIAVRGDNSLTFFNVSGGGGDQANYSLYCNDDDDPSQHRCSGDHIVDEGSLTLDEETGEQEDVTLGADPFAVALIPGGAGVPDRVVTGSLRTGTVTLMDIVADDPDFKPGYPRMVAQYDAVQGVHTLAADPVTGFIYMTNKYVPAIYKLGVTENVDGPTLGLEETVLLPSPFNTGDYGRGFAFAREGRFALIAYRTPPSVLVLDGGDDTQSYEQTTLKLVPVGAEPAHLRVFPSGPGGKELAYVVCHGDNVVWVLDTETFLPIAKIPVGGGPYDMAGVFSADLKRGYVSNFVGHTVSVIDLDPDSPYYHTQIAEIH